MYGQQPGCAMVAMDGGEERKAALIAEIQNRRVRNSSKKGRRLDTPSLHNHPRPDAESRRFGTARLGLPSWDSPIEARALLSHAAAAAAATATAATAAP